MSLANLIVQPGRAVLQADAAGFLADGRISMIRPKILPFEAARAACSLRGSVELDLWLSALNDMGLGATTSMRRLLKALPEALRAATAATMARFDSDAVACLYVVGWDASRRRPFGLILTNSDLWFPGELGSYRWQAVDQCFGSIEATKRHLGDDVRLHDLACFNIDRDSLALIEAQRAEPWGAWPIPDPGHAVAHRIGGWADQAEVTARGVTVKRLVTWPDRVGELVAL